jgi:hypothetical protein
MNTFLTLVTFAAVIALFVLVDIVVYAYLCEAEERKDAAHGVQDWRATPEGMIAKKPFGALYVVIARRLKNK